MREENEKIISDLYSIWQWVVIFLHSYTLQIAVNLTFPHPLQPAFGPVHWGAEYIVHRLHAADSRIYILLKIEPRIRTAFLPLKTAIGFSLKQKQVYIFVVFMVNGPGLNWETAAIKVIVEQSIIAMQQHDILKHGTNEYRKIWP